MKQTTFSAFLVAVTLANDKLVKWEGPKIEDGDGNIIASSEGSMSWGMQLNDNWTETTAIYDSLAFTLEGNDFGKDDNARAWLCIVDQMLPGFTSCTTYMYRWNDTRWMMSRYLSEISGDQVPTFDQNDDPFKHLA